MKHYRNQKEQMPVPSSPECGTGIAVASANSRFLHAGQVHVSSDSQPIVLILGSCVAVCIWDPVNAVGGATHFLLPTWDGRGAASPRYGTVAIAALLQKLAEAGARKDHLRAKVFGGGCLFDSMRRQDSSKDSLGRRNVQTALEILAQERISVASVETGTDKGQRVVFHPETGESSVTTL